MIHGELPCIILHMYSYLPVMCDTVHIFIYLTNCPSDVIPRAQISVYPSKLVLGKHQSQVSLSSEIIQWGTSVIIPRFWTWAFSYSRRLYGTVLLLRSDPYCWAKFVQVSFSMTVNKARLLSVNYKRVILTTLGLLTMFGPLSYIAYFTFIFQHVSHYHLRAVSWIGVFIISLITVDGVDLFVFGNKISELPARSRLAVRCVKQDHPPSFRSVAMTIWEWNDLPCLTRRIERMNFCWNFICFTCSLSSELWNRLTDLMSFVSIAFGSVHPWEY